MKDKLLAKVKDVITGIRMAGGVISRERVIAIKIGIVKADCPSRLKGYGGYQEMGAI